jgi:type III restriction enzyme
MAPAVKVIEAAGRRWSPEDLEAPGRGRRTIVSLEREEQERDEYLDVLRSARTQNAVFLRRYIQNRNRGCLNAIHPDSFKGEGYQQESCLGSVAQAELKVAGDRVVEYYEDGVEYQDDPDPDTATWILGEHRPRGKDLLTFARAAHLRYSTLDFNQPEKEFALALDDADAGVWARNPSNASNGFGIPLPAKAEASSRFFPDFLWWVDDATCWALDTTGQHLLNTKVRGKLIALEQPRVALLVRGDVDLATNTLVDKNGWSLVRARKARPAKSEHFDDLHGLLARLIESS